MRQPDWDSGDGRVRLWLGDCREIIDGMEADCVVTDPPYGIGLQVRGYLRDCKRVGDTVHNDDKPFDPRPLLAFGQVVIWGANHFAKWLPDDGAWLAWDKATRDGLDLRIAEYEFAWTNCTRRHQGFRHLWSGAYRDSERGTSYHVCQKPVALMQWCIEFTSGDVVLDPYMGSGPTAIACIKSGRSFMGIELDERHFATAVRRIERALQDDRQSLFPVSKDTETQVELFA